MSHLLLAPMICFEARVMYEKLGIPLVTVHFYPMKFVGAHEPPLAWLEKNLRQENAA